MDEGMNERMNALVMQLLFTSNSGVSGKRNYQSFGGSACRIRKAIIIASSVRNEEASRIM